MAISEEELRKLPNFPKFINVSTKQFSCRLVGDNLQFFVEVLSEQEGYDPNMTARQAVMLMTDRLNARKPETKIIADPEQTERLAVYESTIQSQTKRIDELEKSQNSNSKNVEAAILNNVELEKKLEKAKPITNAFKEVFGNIYTLVSKSPNYQDWKITNPTEFLKFFLTGLQTNGFLKLTPEDMKAIDELKKKENE